MQRHPAKCVKRMIETLLFVDRDGSFRILNKTDHWCVSSVLTHHSDKPKCHQFHKVFRKWRGFIARIFLEILSLCSVPRSLLFRIVFLRSSYRVSELFGTICWMSKQSRWFRQFDINNLPIWGAAFLHPRSSGRHHKRITLSLVVTSFVTGKYFLVCEWIFDPFSAGRTSEYMANDKTRELIVLYS